MDTELLYAASNGRAEPGYCNVTNIDSIYIVPCKGWMLLSSIALTTISLQSLEWLITKTMKIWNFIPTKTVIKTDSTVCHFHVYQNVAYGHLYHERVIIFSCAIDRSCYTAWVRVQVWVPYTSSSYHCWEVIMPSHLSPETHKQSQHITQFSFQRYIYRVNKDSTELDWRLIIRIFLNYDFSRGVDIVDR